MEWIQNSCVGSYAAEILFFVFKVAESMLEPVTKLYIYESVCLQMYPLDDTCQHLSANKDAEEQVQASSANYIMYVKLLNNVPAIVLVLLCGVWSDHAGRKLPVLVTCFGAILTILLYMLSMYIPGHVRFLPLVLIGAGIRGIFGRSAVMTLSLHSYVSDITTKELRTKKMGLLLAMNYFGYLLGCVVTGVLLEKFGFLIDFCVVAALQTLCVLIAVCCMRDTAPIAQTKPNTSTGNRRKPSKLHYLKECLGLLVSERKGRGVFLVTFTVLLLQQMCKSGEMDATLLFVSRSPINLSQSHYGFLLGLDYACLGLASFVILPMLIRCLGLHDLVLIMTGVVFKTSRMLLMAFSTRPWMVFLSAALGGPNAFTTSAAKALISKTAHEDELGRTFSLLSSGETIANLIGSVVFNTIYSATVTVLPGTVFLVESSIYVIIFIMVTVTFIMHKRAKSKARKESSLLEPERTKPDKTYGSIRETIIDGEEKEDLLKKTDHVVVKVIVHIDCGDPERQE